MRLRGLFTRHGVFPFLPLKPSTELHAAGTTDMRRSENGQGFLEILRDMLGDANPCGGPSWCWEVVSSRWALGERGPAWWVRTMADGPTLAGGDL